MPGRITQWEFAEPLGPEERAALATPGDIFAIGRNYTEHVREMGNEDNVPIVLFLKARATLVGDETPLVYPPWSNDLQYEGELVALIGRGGRDIPEAEALEHVWGFAAGLDWTLRDRQRDSRGRGEPWFPAKNFLGSAAVGAFRRRAQVGDVRDLELVTTVNGEPRQRAGCVEMRHDVPALIAHVSRIVPLSPGDAIFTGTPSGVGPVRPGDVVCCTIAGVGSVTTPVVSGAEVA